MKKILILGAGVYQLPLIQKAKELGHYVIVASIPGYYPGFRFADRIYYKDTTDTEAIYKIAKKESIDAICTLGTDVAIKTMGYVCEHLGLVGISEKAGTLSTNKRLMKEAFLKHHVKTGRFRTVHSLKEAYEAFDSLPKPVVFKAVDSSGGRGVIRVSNEREVENAYIYSVQNTHKEYIIVEEYITGKKICAEAAVIEGKLSFFLPNGNILYPGKIDIPIGHFTPCPVPRSLYPKIEQELKKVVEALEIDDCALNADLIIHNDDVYVIEAGARAGGTNLADLISVAYGVDYYKFILNLALGEARPFNQNRLRNCACQILYSERSGYLKACSIEKNDERIVELKCDYRPSDPIKKFEVGPDRIGHLLVQCGDGEDPVAALESIMKTIKIEVSSDPV
ncbi:ATP-grasp domain-containing protein [Hydrogenimonas sp.]